MPEARRIPKYRRIIDELRQEILNGRWTTGQRLPSEIELTRRFETSRLTVNRALQELQRGGLIDRRVGAGSFVRKAASDELVFGLLIPELGQTEIFEPICRGMALAQRPRRHVLLWGQSLTDAQLDVSRADAVCHQLIAKAISGVFFAPLELTPDRDVINQRIVAAFTDARVPVVLLDRDVVPFPQRSRFDLVGIDNRRAGQVVTNHLIKRGCTRLAFVGRQTAAPTVDARIAGFRAALREAGLRDAPQIIRRIDPADQVAVRAMLREVAPDGLICANDHTAAVLMRTLQDAPDAIDRIRIAGVDDVKYASLLPIPLTTIHQPCSAIGAWAITTMLERLQKPTMPARDVLVDFKLVVRASCRPAPHRETPAGHRNTPQT